MSLTAREVTQVEACIRSLLQAHIAMPFGILRERGVVSDLRNRLDAVFASPVVPAEIVRYPASKGSVATSSPYARVGVRTAVLRVQQEIETALGGMARSGATKQLDIALLSESPTLHCAMNGPGDVVQWLEPRSIAAAIEVKASPSAMKAQRGEYIKDIDALLRLVRRHSINGFFVLLDKSLALYGKPPSHSVAIEWDTHKLQEIQVRGPKGRPSVTRRSLGAAGISISSAVPVPPHVQVWSIGKLANGAWGPVRRFAH